jgi:ADP-heptose:LPS heptosyltransferase
MNLIARSVPRLPALRKIAVLRANGIGDLIFSLPALQSLRAAYPDAELTLLAGDWQEEFLRGRGLVDRVVAVPPTKGVWKDDGDAAVRDAFFARMQAEEFDLALQMHGGGRYSNPFVRRLGAKLSAGLRTPDSEPLDLVVPYVYFQHEVMRYLEVAALVGAPPVTFEPSLPVLESDLAEASRICPSRERPLVALNPGASDPRRRWPPERFAAVGDALVKEGAEVVIVGSKEDGVLARRIRASMNTPARSLAGEFSLNGLTGLLSRCALVVSNDSGPLHLAMAVGTPTVGIYWAVNMVNAQPWTRAQHRPLTSWTMTCPLCGHGLASGPCEHEDSIVTGVSVEETAYNAIDLLRRSAC